MMSNTIMLIQVLKVQLASWRYFAVLTLPPFIFAIFSPYLFPTIVVLALTLLTHFFCWRIWLNERLLSLLDGQYTFADIERISRIFWKNEAEESDLTQRAKKLSRLLYRACAALVLQWFILLTSLTYLYFDPDMALLTFPFENTEFTD